ncbi:MAG: hypothetical protein RBU21_07455 [FCB group bacterium]|jgi:hypothetical protein|nr:hypothetical protein [FCB group bacterium]
MSEEKKVSVLVQWRRRYRGGYDAVTMVLYIALVYVWALGIGPLGRDFALMAEPERLPRIVRALWEVELKIFGANATPYLLLNLLLLYACMLLIYRLTNRAVQGPWWLGTLAALFFMANPVHSEAVLNLSGSTDLFPALLGLGALVAYAEVAVGASAWKWALALALFAIAALASPMNAGLIFIILLWEILIVEPGARSWKRPLPFATLALAGIVHFWPLLSAADHRFSNLFAPVYFVAYPLGFLPESAQRFHEHPWTGWVAAFAALAVATLIYWKARRRAILFGILAMLAIRFYPGDRMIDPVHLIGGGQLLLPTVFFNIALVTVFFRMMDHPRWRLPVVSGTTLIVIVFFCMMIRSELAWRTASEQVKAFQAEAVKAGEPIGVLPDYRYFRTAPVCLSESIQHDTPFSTRVPHESLLALHQLHATPLHKTKIRTEAAQWSDDKVKLWIDCATLREAAPWPYDLLRSSKTEGAACVVEVEPKSGALPRKTLPLTPPADAPVP